MKGLSELEKALKLWEKNLEHVPSATSLCVKRYLPKTHIMVIAPHPDDEILSGAIALRLQKENRCQVTCVAATLGSAAERKSARRQEFKRAGLFLNWTPHVLPEDWSKKEKALISFIRREKPSLIVAPHLHDHHMTHIRTSRLVSRAIKVAKIDTTVAWAEFWSQQKKPNLLIEISRDDVLRSVKALGFHKGEMLRNPYHWRLPGWLMDNVRRGSEWLSGQGTQAASFPYGQIYRIEKYHAGSIHRKNRSSAIFSQQDDLSDLFSKE